MFTGLCRSQPRSEELLLAVGSGWCRDSWLVRVLRINDHGCSRDPDKPPVPLKKSREHLRRDRKKVRAWGWEDAVKCLLDLAWARSSRIHCIWGWSDQANPHSSMDGVTFWWMLEEGGHFSSDAWPLLDHVCSNGWPHTHVYTGSSNWTWWAILKKGRQKRRREDMKGGDESRGDGGRSVETYGQNTLCTGMKLSKIH